ncbi:MAG: amidohydrolase family protein, partial [Ginsengibacter sp.]
DILIFEDQLQYVPKFVSTFPNQLFVIDHIAKPNIKAQTIDEWKEGIAAVAKYENVFCKISGLVTEADWKQWKQKDFTPFLDVIVNSFGTNRIMFGSDWPVCLVAASYEKMLSLIQNYFSSFSENEQENFFGLNAIRFYDL